MPDDELATTWGHNLTKAREALDLSIGALARRTGIHKSHLARFELGEAGLGDAKRIRVAAEVGQAVHDLFPYPDTTPKDSACPSADSAKGPAASRTRPTRAATPSPAPSAAGPAESAPAANPATEVA